MAARMPIVLVQFPMRQVERQQFEEKLVGGLLMEDGAEVTVVEDLEQLDDGQTGLLCLEGITGDLILLSWNDSRRAHQLLAEKGIHGRFGETPLSTPADQDVKLATGSSDVAGRRIFHMDLRQSLDSAAFRHEIAELREALSIKTVNPFEGLGGGLTEADSVPRGSSQDAAESTSEPPAEPSGRKTTAAPSYDDDDQLDAFLDQLDEL